MIWLILLLSVFASVVFIGYFWKKTPKGSSQDSKQSNIEIAREKLAQLDADVKSGVLSRDLFAQAKTDITQNLSLDLANIPKHQKHQKPFKITTIITSLSIIILVATFGIYALIGQSDIIAKLNSLEAVQDLTGLERFVSKNPNNNKALKMLAYAYSTNNELIKSSEYYQRAYQIDNRDIQTLVEYASVLAAMQNSSLVGRPAELIREALSIDNNNITALYLAGLAAYQQGQLMLAQKAWMRALAQVELGSDDYNSISGQLQVLVKQINSSTTTTLSRENRVVARDFAHGSKTVVLDLSINPKLLKQAHPNDFVLIYAKNTTGMPAPLAIIRKQVKDLPLKVQLSDKQAMISDHNLTSAKQIIITARISKSGKAVKQDSDIEVSSKVIDLEKTQHPTIKLTFD